MPSPIARTGLREWTTPAPVEKVPTSVRCSILAKFPFAGRDGLHRSVSDDYKWEFLKGKGIWVVNKRGWAAKRRHEVYEERMAAEGRRGRQSGRGQGGGCLHGNADGLLKCGNFIIWLTFL
jgi:hypothetical protein